ncbi:MAG: tRNA uridine-5-carboxymethylaminomethyl(34) synthesis GTPase MnmE [Acidobacteriota bacterium]
MIDDGGTIAAVATPPGRGGMGTVRISGPDAEAVGAAVFRPSRDAVRPGHARASFGTALDPDGAPLDRGFLVFFRRPRSFTGEDTVEITLHGSPYLLGRLLDAAVAAGARMAEPGEFTYRAFRNGRLDLTQAEGIDDLVAARTLHQARTAFQQAEGALSRRLSGPREALVDLVARLEASLEFPDEDDTTIMRPEILGRLDAITAPLQELERSFTRGRLLRSGATVVIAGTPNAGKSSLFNRLVGHDRAIVTETPGTTRDLVSETVEVAGVPLQLVDTAGRGEAGDRIEAEGVRRADEARRGADLVLLVVDGSRPPGPEDLALLDESSPDTLVLVSKRDLTPGVDAAVLRARMTRGEVIEVSARTGEGIDALLAAIGRYLPHVAEGGDVPLTRRRQQREVVACLEALGRARAAALEGRGEELLLTDLEAAAVALGRLTGEMGGEEIYDRIFSTFCIGK